MTITKYIFNFVTALFVIYIALAVYCIASIALKGTDGSDMMSRHLRSVYQTIIK